MIDIQNLHKRFGSLEVLKGVDLQVAKGSATVIIGPSGSGKTTLLRCLNLLEVPTSGTVTIGDQTLDFSDGRKLKQDEILSLRKKSGMVFQSYNLFPHKTSIENVMEGPVIVQRKNKEEARLQALQLLEKVGLSDKADMYPHQLSGGQQQRIGIARAMALNPSVLLFDEPTSALDPELVGDVLKVMKDLANEGMTMVVVTHEMNFARNVADQVVFIDEGRIQEQGSPDYVFDQSNNERIMQFLNRLQAF